MRCPTCAARWEPGARFCGTCGARRTDGRPEYRRDALVGASLVLVLVAVAIVPYLDASRSATTPTSDQAVGVSAPSTLPTSSPTPACPCLRWERRVDETVFDGVPEVAVHGDLVLVLGRASVVAFGASDGERRWRITADAAGGGSLAAAGLPNPVIGLGGEVIGLDPADGSRRWSARGQVLGHSSAWVLVRDEQGLAARHRRHGSLRWRRDLDLVQAHAPRFGRPVVLVRDGTLHGLHPLTGEDAWVATGFIRVGVLSGGDTLVVAGPHDDGTVVALRTESGAEVWRQPIEPPTPFSEVVTAGSQVFIDHGSGVVALDAVGRRLWQHIDADVTSVVHGPFGLAVADLDDRIEGLHPATGQRLWFMHERSPVAMAGAGLRLFVVSRGRGLVAYDLPTVAE